MLSPPSMAGLVSRALLPARERERLRTMPFHDAGHGYDTFGMHPDSSP